MLKIVAALILSTQLSMAATIAVIDSGTDTKHVDFSGKIWNNAIDSTENRSDEDGNGYTDDILGWNFAEKNNQVIDYKYLGTFSDNVYRYFELQAKMFEGTITEDEKNWMKTQRSNEEFIKELMKFGNFVHGTHVAGITVQGDTKGEILSIKLIPTEVQQGAKQAMNENGPLNDELNKMLLKFFMGQLIKRQAGALSEIGTYVNGHKAQVANGSFGTGPAQAAMITKLLFEQFVKREPTEAELKEFSAYFLENMVKESKGMVDAAPKTLFVFAAGNDGSNNDEMPTSPASIQADNVIAVAATHRREKLAVFSSYGASKVHVAAPGVSIRSAEPGNKYLKVSGTSQASPYVANIAGQIVDANAKLTPKEIKQILMGTVDKKGYLSGKVVSGGIVNMDRAVTAARLSVNNGVTKAIKLAREKVADIGTVEAPLMPTKDASDYVLPLPSGFSL